MALDCDDRLEAEGRWTRVFGGATMAGHMTAHAWWPRLGLIIGLRLVWTGVGPGDKVRMMADGRECAGELRDLPFL